MSNMVVRTNVFALNAHRNLTNVGLAQRQAAQRLSSGFRVNSAADDAAGLAISESMRAQIRGLDQASINTQDGVGLIQTAEGAMATVSDMVIRIRELMVQAANDTYTLENREVIQLEIDQLMTEINDVTFRTEFNTRTLLAGGLGGEGGGPSSPVSLQWMVFNQARVIGLSHPGGVVTSTPAGYQGRLPNVHYNSNNRNNTSIRAEIISLQNELNALARRVAERKVADPGETFDGNDLNEMFVDVRDLDFSTLNLITAERTQLQSISNRIEQLLRTGLRSAEEAFQITQDQINALGGAGSINADGSTVFSGPAIAEWEAARDTLESVRNGFETGLSDLNAAMASTNPLENMNQAIQSLVGVIGGTGIVDEDLINAAAVAADATETANVFANFFHDGSLGTTGPDFAGLSADERAAAIAALDGRSVVPGVLLVNTGSVDVPVWALRTHSGETVEFGELPDEPPFHTVVGVSPQWWHQLNLASDADAEDFALALGEYLNIPMTGGGSPPDEFTVEDLARLNNTVVAPGVFLRIPATGDTGDITFVDAFGQEVDPPDDFLFTIPPRPGYHFHVTGVADGRIIASGQALAPVNTVIADMESLLDLATDVLGNVNLESNAMWFQIGANTMQGTILQLKGIHTGILGAGRGDLATLIDVRKRSGEDISAQIELIDIAEGIVNAQRAQLGAVQNRLEFTRQSLDISGENLAAAESRIRDTDMAREMMRFTQSQVLQQAGISMLAQANQLPASILQLLQ